jgi:hypothetical protein
VNALVAEEQERRQLAADYLDWRLDRLDVRRKRPSTSGIRVWTWDQLTGRAPAPPPATSQARPARVIKQTVPAPMAAHGWRVL